MEYISDVASLMNDLRLSGNENVKYQFKESLLKLIMRLNKENDNAKQEILISLKTVVESCCDLFILHAQEFQTILKNICAEFLILFEHNTLVAENKIEENEFVPHHDFVCVLLEENIRIILCFESLLRHFNESKEIDKQYILTVPVSVAKILYITFKHLKQSKDIYKTAVQSLENNLKMMFDACCGLQELFLIFLQNSVKFNCASEAEKQLLVEVFEKLLDIGEILLSLNIKVMAVFWTGFVTLLQTYSQYLKRTFNVDRAIVYISKKIVNDLIKITTSSVEDIKPTVHVLKADNFLLKIIIKICQHFTGYLDDCCTQLCQLIFALFRYSTITLSSTSVSSNIANEIHTYMSVGADPLLNYVIEDRVFSKVYVKCLQEKCAELSDICDQISVLLSLLSVLKILLSKSNEIRILYLRSETDSILYTTFDLLSKVEIAFCTDVRLTLSNSDGIPQEVSLYDALLIEVTSFIVCAISTADGVSQLETLLVKHVFSSKPLVALFSVDLWCNIFRYGSDDLQSTQMSFLLHILNSCTLKDLRRQEIIYLRFLIKRLFNILPIDQKCEIMRRISSKNLISLYTLYDQFPNNDFKTDITNNMFSRTVSDLENLINNSSNQLTDDLILRLYCLSQIESEHLEAKYGPRLSCMLPNMWDFAEQRKLLPEEEMFSIIVSICENFFSSISDSVLLSILQRISKKKNNSSYMKLNIGNFLSIFGSRCFDNSSRNTMISLQASLYKSLLMDNNPIILQYSLEVFSTTALVTNYDDLIMQTVSASDVGKIFNDYLQKLPPKSSAKFADDFCNYIKRLYSNCDNINYTENSSETAISNEHVNFNKVQSIDRLLTDINEKLMSLKNYFLNGKPDESNVRKLLHTINLIESLKQYV